MTRFLWETGPLSPPPPPAFFGGPLGSVGGSPPTLSASTRGLWPLPQPIMTGVTSPAVVGLVRPSASASATASAPLPTASFLPPQEDTSLLIGDSVEQIWMPPSLPLETLRLRLGMINPCAHLWLLRLNIAWS